MKIKLHYSLIVLIVLALLSGFIHKIILMYIIITLHEIGHLIALKHYKRSVDEIILFPYGGIIKYNNSLNKPIKEEIIISLSGLFVNVILLVLLRPFKNLYEYNLYVLVFNALPIYPLDGGKLFELLLNKFFPFKKCLKIMPIISLIEVIVLYVLTIIFVKRINALLILTFLLVQNIKEIRIKKHRFFSFIINKLINPNKKLKKKNIKGLPNVVKFCKGVNNVSIKNDKEVEEIDILKDYFHYQ